MKYFIVRKLDEADTPKVQQLVSEIHQRGAQEGWTAVDELPNAQLIIAVGGDGTMLYAMHLALSTSAPVVGFNIGKIGFLAEFSPQEPSTVISNTNMFLSEERTALYDTVYGHTALNEFVITPAMSKDTLKYEFFVNGVSSGTYHANGLIISTPTGSTAYSLSVGGAVIQPTAPVFQIIPVAPMSMSSRGVIISDDEDITVLVKTKPNVRYNLIADGQVCEVIESPDKFKLHFERHSNTVSLVHSSSWNFFTVLRQKLRWNAEI